MPTVLVIGGTDSSGGAGVSADIETISYLGGSCLPIITAVTAQGNNGLFHSHAIPPSVLANQLDSIDERKIDAVKIGMIPNHESIEVIASYLKKNGTKSIVLDPVIKSSSGYSLISDSAAKSLRDLLFPNVSLVTPNLFEAKFFTEENYTNHNQYATLADQLIKSGANAVLLKGGHVESPQCEDIFLSSNGEKSTFAHERIPNGTEVRGTGCRLASSISYYLAMKEPMSNAISLGVSYLQGYISLNT